MIRSATSFSASLPDARRELAARLLARSATAQKDHGGSIPKRESKGPAPLSHYQEQIYRHAQLAQEFAPGSLLYNETITFYRRGPLDVAALEQSLTEIVRRHEAWRTNFKVVNGEVQQEIQPLHPVTVKEVDLRGLPDGERELAFAELGLQDLRRPFDLAKDRLFRFCLIRMADEDFRLLLSAHQIILDGVSVYHVLLPEIAHLYAAYSAGGLSPLPEPSIQVADYACWQREHLPPKFAGDLAFWKQQLGQEPCRLSLPADRPRPAVQTFRGAIQQFALSETLAHDLRALAHAEGVTLFAAALAGFVALLHSYTKQEDIVVGTLAPTREFSEVQRLLGYFLNPVVLRVDASGNPTLRELMLRTRDVVIKALAHSSLPFHHLVDALQADRDRSSNPLYQVQFSLEPPMPESIAGWNLTPMDLESGGAKLDLYVVLDERPNGILGRAQYNPDLFEAPTVQRLVERYSNVLQVLASRTETRLHDVPQVNTTGSGATV